VGLAVSLAELHSQPITLMLRQCAFKQENKMVRVGLYVHLEAKRGKEDEVESFLSGGLTLVQEEPETILWFALRLGPSTFGIFDAFPTDAGRRAHIPAG
jgi:hypothetical protein